MNRIATLIVAGALVLAASSTASAQVNLSFGNPLTGRGTTLSFGQPGFLGNQGFIGQPGLFGNQGVITQQGFYGQPGIVGQPGFYGQPGLVGRRGFYGQQGFYGQPGIVGRGGLANLPYAGFASPYAGYSGLGYNAIAPYSTGTTYYSSGFGGYVAPSNAIIQRSYTSYPYYGFGAGSPYTNYGLPLNRPFGLPLR